MTLLDTLQPRLEDLIASFGIPGAGVAIWHDGQLHEYSAGVTNLNTGVPVDADTLFLIGSITKTMTTTLIMQLVERGDLDLDKPVRTYLPDLQLGTDDATEKVTVRRLVTHTSGIPGDYVKDFGRGDDALDRYVKTFSDIGHLHEPGTMISYSNSAFGLAGRLIERTTGQTWDDVLRERLLNPLGMMHLATLPEDALRYRVAVGHRPKSESDPSLEVGSMWLEFRAGAPAGFTPWAAPRDLITFAKLHMNQGKSDSGHQVLSPSSVSTMQEVQKAPFASGSWDADGIGLGFFRFTYGPDAVFGHNGGRSATLRFIPARRFAISVLTNASGGTSMASTLIGEVVNDLFGITPRQAPAADSVQLDPARYVGTFEHVQSRFRIEHSNDHLALINDVGWGLSKNESFPLLPVSATTFITHLDKGESTKVGFVEPDDDGKFGYAHLALRAFRRVE